MDPNGFDRITRLFAERRLTRRQAARAGGAGLAAGALAATGLAPLARARQATPEASELIPFEGAAAKSTEFLFVQSFQQGNIIPKAGEAGTWTLTLEQGLGQTVYFSNRPERIVGASPTEQFLDGLGFSPDNPPNAALLFTNEHGHEDIVVIELFNPHYETDTHTATYDFQLLAEYKRMGITFQEQPMEPPDAEASFGAAHLFIDECADRAIYCMVWDNQGDSDAPPMHGWEPQGFCYSWGDVGCYPCDENGQAQSADAAYAYWRQRCTDTFEECSGGGCVPLYAGPMICPIDPETGRQVCR